METPPVYNIDTSALIYLEAYYPREHFETIWINLEKAFENKIIYITDNVWKEIQAYSDPEAPLVVWMKDKKIKMVRAISDEHMLKAVEIIRENPEIIKDNASVDSAIKENADAYVIAHSLVEKTIVLTGEKKYDNLNKSPKNIKIRIPHICEKYKVECVSLKPLDQEAVIPLYLIQTLGLNKKAPAQI